MNASMVKRIYNSIVFRPLSTLWVVSMTLLFLLADKHIGLPEGAILLTIFAILLIELGIRRELSIIRRRLEEDRGRHERGRHAEG